MEVSVMGAGYVGLVTAACLAEQGNRVLVFDPDEARIADLERGVPLLHEAGLMPLIAANLANGRLGFTSRARGAVEHGDAIFIAVGTPPAEDGSADLHQVLHAARLIGMHMDGDKVIVDKSTVPVGTAERVQRAIAEELELRGVSHEFAVVANPEFLKEGAAVADFNRPDRIVIGLPAGAAGARAAHVLRTLYAPFNRHHERTHWMDTRSAEFTKYAANAMLATRISFMNEMANLADLVGVDIDVVRLAMGADKRIGESFLYAGCGYGGSCFPKDVRALIRTGEQAGQSMHVLHAVELVNHHQKRVLGLKVTERFGPDLHRHTFALWGLAFKPDTDDVRQASSLVVLEQLVRAGAAVAVYDPVAADSARRALEAAPEFSPSMRERIRFASGALDAARGADALLIITEWKEFRSPDFAALKAALRTPVVFDGRNLYDPAAMLECGIEYHGIGRSVLTRLAAEPGYRFNAEHQCWTEAAVGGRA